MTTPLRRASDEQLAVLRAYVETGCSGIDAAAHKLGIKPQLARHRLVALYRRTGARNIAHAAYWFGLEKAN